MGSPKTIFWYEKVRSCRGGDGRWTWGWKKLWWYVMKLSFGCQQSIGSIPQAKMIRSEELCYQRKHMEIRPEMAEDEVTVNAIEENSQTFSLYQLKIPLLVLFFLFSLCFSYFSLFQNISHPQAFHKNPRTPLHIRKTLLLFETSDFFFLCFSLQCFFP